MLTLARWPLTPAVLRERPRLGCPGTPRPAAPRPPQRAVCLPSLQGMPPLSPEKPALCAGCGGKISDRYYLLAVDKQWHLRCLKCCECKLALESELTCFAKDGSIYCKEDYYRYPRPCPWRPATPGRAICPSLARPRLLPLRGAVISPQTREVHCTRLQAAAPQTAGEAGWGDPRVRSVFGEERALAAPRNSRREPGESWKTE